MHDDNKFEDPYYRKDELSKINPEMYRIEDYSHDLSKIRTDSSHIIFSEPLEKISPKKYINSLSNEYLPRKETSPSRQAGLDAVIAARADEAKFDAVMAAIEAAKAKGEATAALQAVLAELSGTNDHTAIEESLGDRHEARTAQSAAEKARAAAVDAYVEADLAPRSFGELVLGAAAPGITAFIKPVREAESRQRAELVIAITQGQPVSLLSRPTYLA